MEPITTLTPTQFRDKKGRIWDVAINLLTARRVDNSDYSALSPKKVSLVVPDKDLIQLLTSNVNLLMAVIWTLVQDQVEKLTGVDPKKDVELAELEFLSAMDGKTIKSAKAAFWGAAADFFPDQATLLQSIREQEDRLREKLNRELEDILPEMEALAQTELTSEVQSIRQKIKEYGERSKESSPSLDAIPLGSP